MHSSLTTTGTACRTGVSCITVLMLPALASAATYHVGPGRAFRTLRAAAGRLKLKAGDEVLVHPGARIGGSVYWNARGSKARPVVVRGVPAEGRKYVQIFLGERGVNFVDRVNVFGGCSHMRIERLRFYGATSSNFRKAGANGERIMFLAGCSNITIRHCRIDHNMAQGITGNGTDLLVEHCEIDHNGMAPRVGRGAPYYHNVYWNSGGRVTMRGCYIHDAYAPPGKDAPAYRDSGQCLKSRADYLRLEACLVVSGHNNALNFVNGKGLQKAEVIGCVIVKNTYVANHSFNTVGGDYAGGTYQAVFMNTTFVQRHGGPILGAGRGRAQIKLINCAFASLDGKGGKWSRGVKFSGSNNYFQKGVKPPPGLRGSVAGGAVSFVSPRKLDFRLRGTSALLDRGTSSGIPRAVGLPGLEYVHPLSTAPRPHNGKIDIGAYELKK